jgi:hypothetical protein
MLVGKAVAPTHAEPVRPDYDPKPEHFASIFEEHGTTPVQETRRPVPIPVVAEVKDATEIKPLAPIQTAALEPPPSVIDHTPVGFQPEGKHYTTISGPSFLGLDDDSPSETDTASYLFEDDEPRRSHAGWYAFSFIAIAVLAVIGLLAWRSYKTGTLSIPFFGNSPNEKRKTPDQPALQPPPQASATQPPDPSAEKTQSGQPPVDDAQPDRFATDHTPASTRPDNTQSPSPTPSSDKTAKPALDDNTVVKKDTALAAATTRSTNSAAPEKLSAEQKFTTGKNPASTEPSPEKPDPRLNRMLVAGEKYLYGRGVRRDCNQALIYLRAAAEEENGPAMSHLGAMYASGNCVKLDRPTAYSWFMRAQQADPDNEWISRNLNMLWRDMSSQERAALSR